MARRPDVADDDLRVRARAEQRLSQSLFRSNDIMRELAILPGPEVGRILNVLFERVLDEPSLNTREKLIELAKAMRP